MVIVEGGGGGGGLQLSSLSFTTSPAKVTYKKGDALDMSGSVLTASYSDGKTENVTSSVVYSPANGSTLSTAGDIQIIATYTRDDMTVSTVMTIHVAELVSLAFTTAPTKTKYSIGGTLDMSGSVLLATWDNDSTENVTSSVVYSPANGSTLSTAGDVTVTASYTKGGVTVTAMTTIIVNAIQIIQIFGVSWNYGNSSPALTRLTTDNDSIVNTDISTSPSPAIGTGSGSSPFDSIYPWSEMEEYNVADNAITYKQGDSGFSRSNEVVVKLSKFYYKVVDDSSTSTRKFYISDNETDGFTLHPAFNRAGVIKDAIYVGKYSTGTGHVSKTGLAPLVNLTRASFRTNAASKGSKWSQWDYASWCAICLLYLVEFANWDSQTMIGKGVVNTSAAVANGGTDGMAYHTGRSSGTDGSVSVQYRHIENLWGNIYQWVDGINFSSDECYVCTNPAQFADDTASNYTDIGAKGSNNGWISGLSYLSSYPYALLPGTASGSSSTFIPDYYYRDSGWRVLRVGGNRSSTSNAGLFCFSWRYGSASAPSGISSRLLFQ